jgi:Protein of unknown function (DUF551)
MSEDSEKSCWQSMETAPRDGTVISLWAAGAYYPECYFEYGRWVLGNGGWTAYIQHPTHWMPLPQPPSNVDRTDDKSGKDLA